MVLSLEGAEVVVLGASSGMGRATAAAARALGAAVTIVARDAERLDLAAKEVGDGVRARSLDAADADAMHALFAELDRVDHVACFTGEQPHSPIGEASKDQYERAMDARVWAARNACAYAAPKMPPTGSFTFCSGASSWRPRADRSIGAAATGATESFARAMAVELAPIRVNTVCPGAFDTAVLERAFGERRYEALRPYTEKLPIPRLGDPAEIAHAVCFLMCNTYTTGTVLHVNGGSHLV